MLIAEPEHTGVNAPAVAQLKRVSINRPVCGEVEDEPHTGAAAADHDFSGIGLSIGEVIAPGHGDGFSDSAGW